MNGPEATFDRAIDLLCAADPEKLNQEAERVFSQLQRMGVAEE